VPSNMTSLVSAGAIAVALGTGGAAVGIVGGGPAQKAPSWIGSLQSSNGDHGCGISLVTSTWAVTAKHCTEGGDLVQVRFGSLEYGSGGELVDVSDTVSEPNGADVSLVQLSTAVSGAPVTIGSSSPAPGTAITLLGWGQTAPEPGGSGASPVLKELDTQVADDSSCSGGGIDGGTELCIEGSTDQTACYGDSGGPAVVGGMLVGATSRSGGGSTCGESDTVYEDLTTMRDWITQTTGGGGDPGEDPGNPGEDPGNPGEDPGNPGEDPGNPGEDPGNPGEDPGNPGEDPGNPGEDPGNPGEDPGNPGEDPDGDPWGGPGEDPWGDPWGDPWWNPGEDQWWDPWGVGAGGGSARLSSSPPATTTP
jgi:hypothetical protein